MRAFYTEKAFLQTQKKTATRSGFSPLKKRKKKKRTTVLQTVIFKVCTVRYLVVREALKRCSLKAGDITVWVGAIGEWTIGPNEWTDEWTDGPNDWTSLRVGASLPVLGLFLRDSVVARGGRAPFTHRARVNKSPSRRLYVCLVHHSCTTD